MIGAVIPAKDEEKNIDKVILHINSAGIDKQHIYVIDNCSEDDTAKIAKDLGVNVITALKPGYQHTLSIGLQVLVDKNYSIFCIVDGDNEINADAIKTALSFYESFGFICGKRKSIKRFGEKVINKTIRSFYGIEDLMCGLKVGKLQYFNSSNNLEYGLDLFNLEEIESNSLLNIDISLNPRNETRLGSSLKVNIMMTQVLIKFLLRKFFKTS